MKKFTKRLKRKLRFNSKTNSMVLFLFSMVLVLGVGFAYLNTNISVTGTGKVTSATWDVHVENIVVNPNSSNSIEGNPVPTISSPTSINLSVGLDEPGKFYEFTFDVVNEGSINAMVDSLTVLPELTEEQEKYLTYQVTYDDGISIEKFHSLNSRSIQKIKFLFKYEIIDDPTEYPDEDQVLNFTITLNYVQSNSDAFDKPIPVPDHFADDSWSTIINAVRTGNTSAYNIGDFKDVNLGTYGVHTLRIVNKSTPDECASNDFSQSSCGFVLEFADIITTHNINDSDTNIGGWPLCSMRTFINDSIYNSLPVELRLAVIDTDLITGHGSYEGAVNDSSTDKMFLLSSKEVGLDSNYDSAKDETRTLDYYTAFSGNSNRAKRYEENYYVWWLRTPNKNASSYFGYINNVGSTASYGASNVQGVSPAFRIG